MRNLLFSLVVCLIGCAHCSSDPAPNIRIIPGSEYCSPYCVKITNMKCTGYYEDITFDGGTMTCTEFCQYEMNNSVNLNPQCLLNNLKDCADIEKICLDN